MSQLWYDPPPVQVLCLLCRSVGAGAELVHLAGEARMRVQHDADGTGALAVAYICFISDALMDYSTQILLILIHAPFVVLYISH